MTGNAHFESVTRAGGARRTVACLLLAGLLLSNPIPSAQAGALEDAQAAAEKGEWAAAADLFAKVLAKSRTNRDAAIGLTQAAVKAQRADLYRAAEEALLTLKERNPSDWEVRIALGEISLATKTVKSDTLAKKSYDVQAIENFQAALKGRPDSAAAAAGLARAHFEAASFQKAVEVVDAFLARNPPGAARPLFWKGQALYFTAQDAFRAAGGRHPLPDDVAGLFRKAQGAFLASTRGDPSSYDAWMQLAYSSQYLGERDTALDAYKRAAALNPESAYPFKGIEAVLAHDRAQLAATLEALVRENPDHPQALFYYAYNRYVAQDYAQAAKHFKRFVKLAKQPAEGWYWLGMTHERDTNEPQAVAAFVETLKADPDHAQAAWALDQRIIRSGARDRAAASLEGAREVIARYRELLELAPRNAYVRNNLAFTLREAYVAHQGSKDWIPILEEATKTYVEASAVLGEWTAEKERTLDWGQRYAQAQVISDTGLMFQFYEPTRDYEKAEVYYDRALEYTENGYRDAFSNLAQIYAEQERWDDLYELADVCSEGIKTERGQPDEDTRSRARAIMKRLRDEGKVSY